MVKTEVWDVTWHVSGMDREEDSHTSSVALIEGYSTLVDIPKIIATTRTGDPKLAHLVIVDSMTRVEE